MTKPVRLQLSRRKGFNLRALSRETNGLDAVVVSRPGPLGNPWHVSTVAVYAQAMFGAPVERSEAPSYAVSYFESWITGRMSTKVSIASETRRREMLALIPTLRGKNLACWCKLGAPCHADVLLEIANA